MQVIQETMDQLASAAIMADSNDLQLLAQMHTHFQNLVEQVQKAGGVPAAGNIKERATVAEKLVEQIILREIVDTDEALKRISQSVTDIQGLLNGDNPQTIMGAASNGASANPAENAGSAEAGQGHGGETPLEKAINADDVPMVQEFISEARTHLDTAEVEILKVEDAPEDLDAVNAIFRSFHTIKGVAGFLNLQQIGALAHNAENMLDLARKGQLTLAGQAVDIVLDSIDVMKVLIRGLEEAVTNSVAPNQEPRVQGLITRIKQYLAGTQESNDTQAAALAAASVEAASHPQTAAVPAENKVSTEEVLAAAAASATPSITGKKTQDATQAADTTIKVATDRLDNLINMVGELVIAQAMVAQDMTAVAAGNQKLARNMGHLSKITRELQDLSMSMRMVPIQGVFQKMARLVRDLARKSGKQIDFSYIGGDTELDRNVVEAISDPLVHMVRNSADHGVESMEDRIKAGKSPAGKIQLKASHQSGNIVIEIIDDGKGLNKAKILKKALETGVIREGQELSEQEIFRLIFQAGLSTAEKVTDVSGRGVGMDVVRKNVEAMRGRIEISSVEGQGSTFTIRLPLTLAVIDGLVVKVGADRYIIPITSIEQSIQPKAEQISTVQNTGEMLMIRGSLLPMFRLHKLFNCTPRTEDPTQALVVIVQHDQKRCCLLVDDLLGQQQVVIKTLGESIGSVRGISGGAILGDGAVSLILDVPGLVDLASNHAN